MRLPNGCRLYTAQYGNWTEWPPGRRTPLYCLRNHIQIYFTVTGVDGVMTAEGNLYNPCLFAGLSPLASEICLEFTEITRTYPYPTLSSVRGHLFKMLHHVFLQPEYADYRQQLAAANTFEEMENMTKSLHSALSLVYGKPKKF